MSGGDDYDYIIRIIQFLDRQFAIRFFISSKDFDILYHWWEKRIPYSVIREALGRVVERRLARGKPVTSFSAFSHDVRRDHQSFLSLNVGRARGEPLDEDGEIKTFLSKFPVALDFIKADFAGLGAEYMQTGAAGAGLIYEKLLTHFQNDVELNAKCECFMENLAPQLRRPEIEKKYRLNYLLHKFAIPSFD
jgi:hypothetical protein